MAYTTPTTAVSGATLAAAVWNASVRDNFKALADAWTSYTPTLTGFTLGNGTIVGYYMQVGKFVTFRAKFTFGTTSAAASAWPTFTLPVTSASNDLFQLFTGGYRDASASQYYAGAAYCPGTFTTVRVGIIGSSGATTQPTTTTPFTWTTSDTIEVAGVYEAG